MQDLFTWAWEGIYDAKSPAGIPKEIYQNLVAAFVGAVFSLFLIAPVTAWIVARNQEKRWRPARITALGSIANALESLTEKLEFFSAPRGIEPRHSADLTEEIRALGNIQQALEEVAVRYARWGDVWTVEHHAAISAVFFEWKIDEDIEMLEHIREIFSKHFNVSMKARMYFDPAFSPMTIFDAEGFKGAIDMLEAAADPANATKFAAIRSRLEKIDSQFINRKSQSYPALRVALLVRCMEKITLTREEALLHTVQIGHLPPR